MAILRETSRAVHPCGIATGRRRGVSGSDGEVDTFDRNFEIPEPPDAYAVAEWEAVEAAKTATKPKRKPRAKRAR